MAKTLDCVPKVNKFKLQLHYYDKVDIPLNKELELKFWSMDQNFSHSPMIPAPGK